MKCELDQCLCEQTTDWVINAPKYDNCYWKYSKNNARPHTLNEISQLLGISISAVTTLEKKALSKLRKKLQKKQ
jgi:hypothetical protein